MQPGRAGTLSPQRRRRAAATGEPREQRRRSRSPGRSWARRRSGGPRGAALRAALARPARAGVRAGVRRRASASPHASAVSSGTAGLHLALRAVGVERRRRGRHVAVLVRRLGQRLRSTSARGRCSPTSTRVTLNLDPQAAAAAVTERTTALLPVHIFGYPADMPAFERARRSPIVEDACEALGARPRRRHARVGGRGHPAVFGFYANKQLTTGEGGMVTTGRRGVKERIDSERNQGRAPDMGWLDHDRLGFNYRLSDIACAIGIAQLERLDAHARGRAPASRRAYREALARHRGARAALRGPRRRPARLVRLRRAAAARAATATRSCARCASAACRASPTCRRST